MPHRPDAEAQLQQVFTLIDRIVGSDSVAKTAEKVPVGTDESILPQFISYIDEFGLPSQVDMTYMVRPNWRADVPMYEQVRRRLNPRTKFRALCRPDEPSWGTDDEISLGLRPKLVYIRSAWAPLPEFAIIDSSTALVKTRLDDKYALVIRVTVPELVRSLSEAFERNWRLSLTPQLYRRLRSALGSPVNQKVLQLLQDGCIDEVAAKRMEVSVRTYRRYVALLMGALEVETRFQMAWRLAQLGV